MKNIFAALVFCTLSSSCYADVLALKPLAPNAVIKVENTNESKLFDLDPKRRQVVLTPTGVYLIEKQSVKAGIFGGKCKGR